MWDTLADQKFMNLQSDAQLHRRLPVIDPCAPISHWWKRIALKYDQVTRQPKHWQTLWNSFFRRDPLLIKVARNEVFSTFLTFSSFELKFSQKTWKDTWHQDPAEKRRRSGQSVTASDFGSNGPRFESGRGRCVESLDKALYSHCPKEKPSH